MQGISTIRGRRKAWLFVEIIYGVFHNKVTYLVYDTQYYLLLISLLKKIYCGSLFSTKYPKIGHTLVILVTYYCRIFNSAYTRRKSLISTYTTIVYTSLIINKTPTASIIIKIRCNHSYCCLNMLDITLFSSNFLATYVKQFMFCFQIIKYKIAKNESQPVSFNTHTENIILYILR